MAKKKPKNPKQNKKVKNQQKSEKEAQDFTKIEQSLTKITKKEREMPVEFNQEVTSLLAKKLDKRGEKDAAARIMKTKVDTPKKKSGVSAFFTSKKFYYSLPVFILLAVIAVGVALYPGQIEQTITALKDEPDIPLITMNPTDLTESGYMSSNSQLKVELGSPIVGNITSQIVVNPEVDFEVAKIVDEGENSSFTIDFGENLQEDTIYEVTLKEGTTFENEAEINKSLTWVFSVDPAFSVIGSSPGDNANGVPINATIEFVFNHVNLDPTTISEYLTISPTVSGKFETIGNKVILLPERKLQTYTEYDVKLHKDYQNLEGESLKEAYSFNFYTGGEGVSDDYKYLGWGGDPSDIFSTTQSFVFDAYVSDQDGGSDSVKYQIYWVPFSTVQQLAQLISGSHGTVPKNAVLENELTQAPEQGRTVYTPEKKGMYYVRASADGATSPVVRRFMRTDAGVITSNSSNDIFGWVYNMNSKTPIAGVQINAIEEGKVSSTVTTDLGGGFDIEQSDYIIGKYGNEFFYYDHSGNDSLYFNWFVSSDVKIKGYDRAHMNISFDKPVYRYGDNVKLAGFVKGLSGDSILPVTSREVEISVINPTTYSSGFSSPFYTAKVRTDDSFGVFEAQFSIPENLDVDYLHLEFKIDGEVVESNSLTIANYAVPQEIIEVEIPQEKAFSGESVTAYVTGRDYNGGPLAGRKVTLNVMKEMMQDDYPDVMEWSYCGYGDIFQTIETTLDSNGHGKVVFTPLMSKDDNWNFATFTLYPEYSGELSVSTESDCLKVATTQSDTQVSVEEKSYVEGDSTQIQFQTITLWDQKELPNQELTAIVDRIWNERVQDGTEYNPDTKTNEPVYKMIPHVDVFHMEDFVTDGSGNATIQLDNLQEGQYRLWLSSDKYEKNDRVLFNVSSSDLGLDSHYYGDYPLIEVSSSTAKVGDKVEVKMKAPSSLNGIYTVQGVDLISSERVVSDDIVVKELTITKEMNPHVDLCIHNIQKAQEEYIRTGNGWTTQCTRVSLESDEGVIDLEVKTDKEVYKPGEEVTVNVKATNSEGKGVVTNLSVAVTNQALLDQYQRDDDLDRDDLNDAMLRRLRKTGSWGSNVNVSFRGGAGGGGGGEGYETKRVDFDDSGYWNPYLVTDSSGKAQFKFTANDSLTEWRIKLIASDRTDGTGAGYTRYKTYMDRYVNVIVPDFIRDGDKIVADLQVVNYGPGFAGEINVKCPNCYHKDQKIPVEIGEGMRKSYDLKLSNRTVQPLELDVQLIGDGVKLDNVGKEVEVIPKGQLTNMIYTTVVESAPEGVTDEYEFELSENEAKYGVNYLNLSRNSGALFAHVPYQPSYKNTSSLASAIAVNSYVLKNYEEISPEVEKTVLEKVIQQQLADMLQNQTPEGSFGDVSFDSSSLDASVVAAKSFYHAQDAGVTIGIDRVSALEKYLVKAYLNQDLQLENRLYALSGVAKIDRDFTISQLPEVNELYQNTPLLQKSPYATSSIASIMSDVGNTGESLYYVRKLQEMGDESAKQMYWSEPESERVAISDLELTALAYTAMAPLEEWSIKYKTRAWLTANNSYDDGEYVYYTTLYSLAIADIDSVVESDSDQKVRVFVNGDELTVVELSTKKPSSKVYLKNDLLKSGSNKVKVVKSGEGETYLEYNVQKVLALETDTKGEKYSYKYYDLKTNVELTPDQLKEGQYLKVQVTYTPSEDRNSVLLKDQWNSTLRPVNLWLNGTPHYVRDNFYDPPNISRWVVYPNLINDTDISASAYKLKAGQSIYFEYVVKVEFTGTSSSGYLQMVSEDMANDPSVLKKTELVTR